MTDQSKIAIIGAGPAGCAAAFAVRKQGGHPVLIEREPEPGGRTRSVRRDGFVLDTGAGFFTNFYPRLKWMLKELGMEPQIVPLSRSNTLVKDGQAFEFTLGNVGSFLRLPFLSGGDKFKLALKTLGILARHRGRDLARPETLVPIDTESIAGDARRRFGENVYQHLIRPGIEPFWYFSCEDVSRGLYLPLQARAPDAKFFTLLEGMDQFCRAVAAVAGVEFRPETSVTGIQSSAGNSQEVRLRFANGVEENFAGVVVATTASVARRITAGLPDGFVSDRQRGFLKGQTYVANVHAAFRTSRADCPAGVAAAFPTGAGRHDVAALNFHSHKRQTATPFRDESELTSVYFGAQRSAELLEAQPDRIFAEARRIARSFWSGFPERAEPFELTVRDEAIPVHAVGNFQKAADFAREQRPPVVFAGDYLATATVEGAIASGLRAAESLRRSAV